MKFIYTFFLFIAMLCTGCARELSVGAYKCNCWVLDAPEVIFEIKSDSSFTYVLPCIRGFQIEGVWRRERDTLILAPEYKVYNESKERITPDDIYAELPVLIVKRNKLYRIIHRRFRKTAKCSFTKIGLIPGKHLSGL